MSQKVLITGGAGFIGQQLASKLLTLDCELHLVDNFARGANDRSLAEICKHPQVVLHQLDLLAPNATAELPQDIEYIVHLAAILGVDNVLKQPFRTLKDNIEIQLAVLEYASRLPNLKRIAFSSTSEVYAGSLVHIGIPLPTPESVPLALTDIGEPRTSYMLSKIYGEALLVHSGLPYVIVRPHNIYGPRMGMSHVIPQLLKKGFYTPDGGVLQVASVDHRRTFCFVADAVEMLANVVLSTNNQNLTLNLGNQSPEISIGELANMVVQTLGKHLRIQALPPTAGSPVRRAPEMSKMLQTTGLTAETPLAEGLRITYDWYKQTF